MNKLEQKMREYVNSKVKNIKYNEESCEILLNGETIGGWNNEANISYPEDLIWRRDISGFHNNAFKAGAELFLPILVEALGALAMVQQYSKVESDKCGHQEYVNKALKSIDEKLGSIE